MYGYPQARIDEIIQSNGEIIQALQMTPPVDLWIAVLGSLLTAERKVVNVQPPTNISEATTRCEQFPIHLEAEEQQNFFNLFTLNAFSLNKYTTLPILNDEAWKRALRDDPDTLNLILTILMKLPV